MLAPLFPCVIVTVVVVVDPRACKERDMGTALLDYPGQVV